MIDVCDSISLIFRVGHFLILSRMRTAIEQWIIVCLEPFQRLNIEPCDIITHYSLTLVARYVKVDEIFDPIKKNIIDWKFSHSLRKPQKAQSQKSVETQAQTLLFLLYYSWAAKRGSVKARGPTVSCNVTVKTILSTWKWVERKRISVLFSSCYISSSSWT